ncbi:MAG: chemotaxis protein CheA [Campylobacterota bacterium]|nr:chemotaxis protein CheA [Campylobacterota bacterium]
MQDDEMIYMFHAESIDLLDEMEDSLLVIQESGMDKEHINAIFRAVHSIKGGAGMFELEQLVHFSHIAENLLDNLRNNKITINNNIITLFLNIKDHLNDLIDDIIQNDCKEDYSSELKLKTEKFSVKLNDYLNGKVEEEIEEQVKENIEEKTKEQVEENISETTTLIKDDSLDEINQTIKNSSEQKDELFIVDNIPTTTNQEKTKEKPVDIIKSSPLSSTLKVESNKIDTLINLVGEMVITTASVMQHSTRINDKGLNESVHLLSRMLEELRETSMKTRMVPIGDTFSRYKRVVRDLSQSLNKEIDLVIEGSETELDKTVIEKISDPLIHLIRNSIDHGIETIQERELKNKNSKAMIKLKAFHESSSITIQVQDDGKGLDKDKILEKAISNGLITKDDKIKDDDIYNLIMQPGFSTAQNLSNISGRGVGMDVVKRNIEELRGTIDIKSQKDIGMSVTIRLPLTLAIIDGFMIKISDDFYIIPLEMLLECIELTQEHKDFVAEHNFINLRDHVLPLLDLREFFGYEKNDNRTKKENIVVVNFGTLKVGLIVDELLGEFQTVIKPMGKVFQNLKGIGGATILGDGRVSPILDIPILLQYANQNKI